MPKQRSSSALRKAKHRQRMEHQTPAFKAAIIAAAQAAEAAWQAHKQRNQQFWQQRWEEKAWDSYVDRECEIMTVIDRRKIHAFLDTLIAGQSPEEQVAMLKDIMVDDFCFRGIGDDGNLADLEEEIRTTLQTDLSQKISLIKKVREKTGLGLAEAKNYVESFQAGHPSYGNKQAQAINMKQNALVSDLYLNNLARRLNEVAKNYGKPAPFSF